MGEKMLSQWLKKRCQKEKLSLRQAAGKTRLSHSTINGIMNGVRPSADTVRKLAHAFGGNGHQGFQLEDELLTLAGHRTQRSEQELGESVGRLIDRLSTFNESQLGMVSHFADFIAEMEEKQ